MTDATRSDLATTIAGVRPGIGAPAVAPFAASAIPSRGRLHAEPPSGSRTPFQRDRDRLVHSTAFRRLTYKTQVFVQHEGDHYRSRLTHSLEVAQIARSMARTLALDEDLAEAVALAHDFGHPPFGHAGERALDAAMADHGGFDHNAQSLRIVTTLERKYAAFDGLNLTWESLEGLVKHNGPLAPRDGARSEGHRAVPDIVRAYDATHDLRLADFACAEAQVAALADDIAYNNHDIDDGFRAGLYGLEDLAEAPLAGELLAEIGRRHHGVEPSRLIHEVNRRLITLMIDDAVSETRRRLEALGPSSPDDVRAADAPMVAFSDAMADTCNGLRDFLMRRVYRHERVTRVMGAAQQVLADLFERYMADPAALPEKWLHGAGGAGGADALARHVCDFIAGMTDRYALKEHGRLFDDTPELR